MKKLFVLSILLFFAIQTNAQNILNGSFENNNATDCNTSFAISGLSPNLSNFNVVYSGGTCLLISSLNCNVNFASDGDWYLMLNSNFVGYGFVSMLDLSSNLIAGNQYTISYDFINPIDTIPLQSAFSDTLEIGYSDTLDYNSTIIVNKFSGNSSSWQTHTFSFIPIINARHLVLGYGSFGSRFYIDNIRILNTLSNPKVLNSLKPIICPNPSNNNISINNINLNKFIDISIYNIDGTLISKQFSTKDIDVAFLTNGYYILEVKCANSFIKITFVKN